MLLEIHVSLKESNFTFSTKTFPMEVHTGRMHWKHCILAFGVLHPSSVDIGK
jgi:hypothetical protein